MEAPVAVSPVLGRGVDPTLRVGQTAVGLGVVVASTVVTQDLVPLL